MRSARDPPVPISIPSHINWSLAQRGSGYDPFATVANWTATSLRMLFSHSEMNITPRFRPVLDPGFVPASLWNRAYSRAVQESGGGEPFALALERSDASVSVFRTRVFPHDSLQAGRNL